MSNVSDHLNDNFPGLKKLLSESYLAKLVQFIEAPKPVCRTTPAIYISGPMRGYEELNFPRFLEVAKLLREKGFDTLDPAQSDIDLGFDTKGMSGDFDEYVNLTGFNLFDSLFTDLRWICMEADAVVTLHGWEASNGAQAEVAVAKTLGIPVYDVEYFLEYLPPVKVIDR